MIDYTVEMEKVSKEIDDFISNCHQTGNLNLPNFKTLCDKLIVTSTGAGSSGAMHPDPEEGSKWLQNQNEKLNSLLKWHQEQTRKIIDFLLGLLLKKK